MSKTIDIYHQQAELFAAQYDALSFEQVHQSWQPYWPTEQLVLDIGAGSGRDAFWLAAQGNQVIAVEPAEDLRRLGQLKTSAALAPKVQWLSDSLPELKATYQLNLRFNTILLSAVWMHISPSERQRTFRKIANLLAPGGHFVLSLRYGDFSDHRVAYPVSVDEINELASKFGLVLKHLSARTADAGGRVDIAWQTLVLMLPDDGSGSLSKVRHIVVNDNKSSTYKLALLRTLVRIAEAHPGAVIDRQDGQVGIALGLVALYWIRLFKRLVDSDMQQNADPAKGLGFVKPDGWGKLAKLTADDFAIGNFYTGEEAQALQQLFADTLSTIKAGPVTYIWQGEKSNTLFRVERHKVAKRSHVLIDRDFLASFGCFVLSEDLWNCFRQYGCWIEPLLVQQWIAEMQKYQRNAERQISLESYHNQLRWLDQQHDTRLVRQKVAGLRSSGAQVCSVWSGAPLYSFDIDHCVPFSYWPNNDLWNLLPASQAENRKKRDRLPSQSRMQHCANHIQDWWRQAWQTDAEQQRFFIEAGLSLPNISPGCRDFAEVLHAMQLQMVGIKQRLQVAEW